MQLVFFKSGFKYTKRTGVPGNYQYWYRTPEGKMVQGKEPNSEQQDKTQLALPQQSKYKEGSKLGKLEKKSDGFWYDGKNKITNNDKKAEEFASKTKENISPANISVGHTVRIKPSATKTAGHQPRGMVATVKEVVGSKIRLQDESGKTYLVDKQSLEMAKSNDTNFELDLIKARTHKYWKRTGTKGRYKYWYKTKSGKIIQGKKPSIDENIYNPIKRHSLQLKKEKIQKEFGRELSVIENAKTKKIKKIVKKEIMSSPSVKKMGKQLALVVKKQDSLPLEMALTTQKLIEEKAKAQTLSAEDTINREKAKEMGESFSPQVAQSKLVFIQKQINEIEKKKTPAERMRIALKIESKGRDIKPLTYNLATINKKQIKELQTNKKIRNQFLIENQALVNSIASKAVKKWKKYMFDVADFGDAKQDAEIGLILAIEKFKANKFDSKAFFNYARVAMTRKIQREMMAKFNKVIKETSIYDEVGPAKSSKESSSEGKELHEFIAQIRDATSYESETGVINSIIQELKTPRQKTIMAALRDGWKPVEIAEGLHVSKPYISKEIKKMLPIVKRYIVKSNTFHKFIKMLERYARG